MSVLGNLIWFVCGGFVMGLAWWIAGVVALISLVGIPWAKACFVIGQFSFFPFGKETINRQVLTTKMDVGTSPIGWLGNTVWFFLAGWWLAIGHIISACACFVTIVGIPFGLQHLKLASISLSPIGKTVVEK